MTSKDNSVEKFCFVWLDNDTSRYKTRLETQKQFENRLQTFDDENKCEHYIRNVSTNNFIVLIVCDHLGRKLIPRIHQFQQVSTIYVYGANEDSKSEWTKEYSKVNEIYFGVIQ